MYKWSLVAAYWRLSGFRCLFLLIPALVIMIVAAQKTSKADSLEPFYPVEINSLGSNGVFSSEGQKLKGYVLVAGTDGKTPGAVLSPACGGLIAPKSKMIRPWYRRMAQLLKRMGITAVLVDGFNPRGYDEICSLGPDRSIDTTVRMQDSLAGLHYLRSRPDIDKNKIFLFTWGAAGSFEAMSKGESDVAKVGGGFTAAVMFYPNCDLETSISPYGPIQVFVGEKDTWNPPDSCVSLAKEHQSSGIYLGVKIFANSYHGFDVPMPPRKMDSGNRKKGSVMWGGNPEARKDAYRRTAKFLSQFITPPTHTVASTPLSEDRQRGSRALTRNEIRELVIGNTLNFVAPSNGLTLFVYFAENGRVQVRVQGRPRVIKKQCSINPQGMLCRTFGKQNKKHCTKIVQGKDSTRLIMKNKKFQYEATLLTGRQLSQ